MNDTRTPTGRQPVDITTMRQSIARLLPTSQTPPTSEGLSILTATLRGHMELLIPEIEQAAAYLPHDDVPRYCALACIGEARGKLRARPSAGEYGALAYARRLARCLMALCDHHEKLTGVRMCLACDQAIAEDDDWLPYDKVSPSGGAVRAGRIHDRCTNTVRRPR